MDEFDSFENVSAEAMKLTKLFEQIEETVKATGPIAHTSSLCDDLQSKLEWVMLVYPALLEVKGGEHDGETVSKGMTVDVLAVVALFDTAPMCVFAVTPESPVIDDYVFFEVAGTYHGVAVRVRFVRMAPPEDEPNFLIDHITGEISVKGAGK